MFYCMLYNRIKRLKLAKKYILFFIVIHDLYNKDIFLLLPNRFGLEKRDIFYVFLF
jgi:hypothetical protein